MKTSTVRGSLKTLGQYQINFGRKPLVFILKRSQRARLVWLKIDSEGHLTVTIPPGYSPKLVPQYLQKNLLWIEKNLEKSRLRTENASLRSPVESISYLGQRLRLVSRPKSSGSDTIKIEKGKLILNLNPATPRIKQNVLQSWLREKAGQLIESKVSQWCQKIEVKFNRITIRDQKTRWASCSCKGNLSFNWRLIMVPESIVDYVIVHELCHLHEMNHSKRFWAWVSRYSPNWREHRRWMDSHTRELKLCFQ